AAAGTHTPSLRTSPPARRLRSSQGSGNNRSARRSPGGTRRPPAARESRSWSAASGRRPGAQPSSALQRRRLGEELALIVLALLADVEAGHRPVIAHHAGPDFAGLALVVTQCRLGGGGFRDAASSHYAISSASGLASGGWAAMA